VYIAGLSPLHIATTELSCLPTLLHLLSSCRSFNAYCPPQFLAWQYRGPRLLAELESYAADLLFLQEVESTVFDQQLQPWMQQRGYHSLFHPRRSPPGTAGMLPTAGAIFPMPVARSSMVCLHAAVLVCELVFWSVNYVNRCQVIVQRCLAGRQADGLLCDALFVCI
jgi:mRNA deadenylase 3'-5' endonuclease subunit Ccr4